LTIDNKPESVATKVQTASGGSSGTEGTELGNVAPRLCFWAQISQTVDRGDFPANEEEREGVLFPRTWLTHPWAFLWCLNSWIGFPLNWPAVKG